IKETCSALITTVRQCLMDACIRKVYPYDDCGVSPCRDLGLNNKLRRSDDAAATALQKFGPASAPKLCPRGIPGELCPAGEGPGHLGPRCLGAGPRAGTPPGRAAFLEARARHGADPGRSSVA